MCNIYLQIIFLHIICAMFLKKYMHHIVKVEISNIVQLQSKSFSIW